LDFVGFIEVKPGVPPSPAHLAGIVRTMKARTCASSCASRMSRSAMSRSWRARPARGVTLAASVGALPQATDYIALFDPTSRRCSAAAR
jgi:zinc/manganese transport system substrate-binding protein/zinc transport system substrate-binding protein